MTRRFGTGRDKPSVPRLFIYYNERLLGGVIASDAPVSLRDGCRAISRFGACPEALWPYDPRRFRRLPSASCYRAAARRLALAYYRIRRSLAHLRACLAEGYPFVFALAVHKSMLSRRRFLVRNSWGPAWGLRGYFHLPYAFTASAALTWDFWTMRRVS